MTKAKSHKIGLFGLIAMVVGAMIGGGIFDIPQNMAASVLVCLDLPLLLKFLPKKDQI